MQLEQLKGLLDILLAAAASDGHTDFKETIAIRRALDDLGITDPGVRTSLEEHQFLFEPGTFSLEESVKAMGHLDAEERGLVIGLLEKVEEADGVIDLEEEEFIQRVAKALGASDEEVAALTMEIIESGPPPIPGT